MTFSSMTTAYKTNLTTLKALGIIICSIMHQCTKTLSVVMLNAMCVQGHVS
jgi:hypothetical protein